MLWTVYCSQINCTCCLLYCFGFLLKVVATTHVRRSKRDLVRTRSDGLLCTSYEDVAPVFLFLFPCSCNGEEPVPAASSPNGIELYLSVRTSTVRSRYISMIRFSHCASKINPIGPYPVFPTLCTGTGQVQCDRRKQQRY